MSDKIKTRQQKISKKRIAQLTVQNQKIVQPHITDEEYEHGWNVGHTVNEEWR